MTEIERKALALVNGIAGHDFVHPRDMKDKCWLLESLCRAIEQHEAFKREVSDAVEAYMVDPQSVTGPATMRHICRFIIAKPDPLVEALCEMDPDTMPNEADADNLRAALAARGLEIREIDQ